MSEPVKYEVAKLEGALLDQAVAFAGHLRNRMHLVPAPIFCEAFTENLGWTPYSPSADGNVGIEIIERFGIELIPQYVLLEGHEDARWWATIDRGRVGACGPTVLIAAMRALVTSKVGAEIVLPGILP